MMAERIGSVCVVMETISSKPDTGSYLYGVFVDEAAARSEYFADGDLTSGGFTVKFMTVPLWACLSDPSVVPSDQ